jgi:L-alanine-DL-glutamate epimerase-like enolase superfamily enzyme
MPGPLIIERIELIGLRVPLDRTYRGSKYKMTHRSTVVVRVETSAGVTGEAYAGDEDAGLGAIAGIIRDEITPALIGLDARAVERCWQAARPATADILRDRRLGLVACACVDTAIWDAVGKALDEPLWRLWGGYRNTIQVTSIGGYYGTGIPIAEEVDELRTRDLAGMKFKVGGLSPAEDAQRFIDARAAAGDDFILMADANQGWSVGEAVDFARRVSDHDLFWFEEPCAWDNDRRAMRDVRLMSGQAVCAGQSEFSAGGCRDLFVEGAVDFCNFDASWSGGPTEWRRAAATAGTFGVRMAHHEEPQVASHLLCSIAHGTFVETFHEQRDPIWHHLVVNKPTLRDGWITLSDCPGLGWELDWDFVERYRVPI